MASAATLKYLAFSLLEKPAHIALGGIVGRAENRAMRTYLNIDLVPISEVRFDGDTQIALVDTQPGRPNNSLPDGIVPHVVIDHHPAYADYPGVPFLDLREAYGATSTILTEYLRDSRLDVDHKIATALFYGISAETQDRDARPRPPTRGGTSSIRTPTSGGWRSRERARAARVPSRSARRSTTALYADRAVISCSATQYPDMVAEVAGLLLRLTSRLAAAIGTFEGCPIVHPHHGAT
jgi:hypothetical protein